MPAMSAAIGAAPVVSSSKWQPQIAESARWVAQRNSRNLAPVGSSSKWQPQIAGSAHRNSRNAWNIADKKPEAAAPGGVISREEFLSGRMLSKQHPLAHLPGTYSLRAEAIAITPPRARPAPPPGLQLPGSETLPNEAVAAESEIAPMPEKTVKQPVVDAPAPEVKEYKVLLQNMPDAMLKECMLRVMLELANLKDVTNLVFRANGKVLVTFASYASVDKCVNHFHGRNWGGAVPVSATYVFVAPRVEERQALAASKALSMAAVTAKSFNANAPVFVPSSEKIDSYHMFLRQLSGASTDAGPASEGASEACDSDIMAQAA